MSALEANSLNKDLEKCMELSKTILQSALFLDLTASTASNGTICTYLSVSIECFPFLKVNQRIKGSGCETVEC